MFCRESDAGYMRRTHFTSLRDKSRHWTKFNGDFHSLNFPFLPLQKDFPISFSLSNLVHTPKKKKKANALRNQIPTCLPRLCIRTSGRTQPVNHHLNFPSTSTRGPLPAWTTPRPTCLPHPCYRPSLATIPVLPQLVLLSIVTWAPPPTKATSRATSTPRSTSAKPTLRPHLGSAHLPEPLLLRRRNSNLPALLLRSHFRSRTRTRPRTGARRRP
jgi:hypothetical protein